MGIPSYYKKLINSIPQLVRKGHPDRLVSWLFMDFNCLIYHCLHRTDTPAYLGDDRKEEWEDLFLDCIVRYCLKVIKEVNPQVGVYIAIDGVVPMAKMRQQRLRRFKSVWLTQHSGEGGSEPVWDRNSITPGTVFMKKLRVKLEKMISGRRNWHLSSSDEPGEGEHKIISEWRKGGYTGNFAVYGLDADLIVLSILGRECCKLDNSVWLFREEVDAGKISYDESGEEVFEWFSINALSDWLKGELEQREFVLNYCFAMSILGNDFLPSSLGLKIRDDGHGELLDMIRGFTVEGIYLVNSETLEISFENIVKLFKKLVGDEDARICKYLVKKQMFARNLEEIAVEGDNNWPLMQFEEKVLLDNRQLHNAWKERYMTHFFNGYSLRKNDIHSICKEYLYGMQWIWAYYTGRVKDVCFNWFYPFNLPPLWCWLTEYLQEKGQLCSFPDRVLIRAEDIKPVEQLAIVLPLDSWTLIPPCEAKKLPLIAPQYYPNRFTFESAGKRFFWECESMIPIPSIYEVKKLIYG